MLGEINMAAKILRTSRPLQVKTLGDKFEDWIKERVKCMINGTLAKFTQNVGLARKLLETGENGLFEATTDGFFGTGVGLGSNLWSTGKWLGKNTAGKICMSVRNLLNEEISKGTELDEVRNKLTYPVSPSQFRKSFIPLEEESDPCPSSSDEESG